MDPRPILLFLHQDNKTKNIEGLNLNYLNPTKLKKLFQVMDFKKTKLDEVENLVNLTEDYFRIQISNPKKRSAMSTKRFYSDVISSDKFLAIFSLMLMLSINSPNKSFLGSSNLNVPKSSTPSNLILPKVD